LTSPASRDGVARGAFHEGNHVLMLIDIFARRYADVRIWAQYTTSESRLITQGFRIVLEQLFPYYINEKESIAGKADWTTLHDRLSMELGVKSLSDLAYSYQSHSNGQPFTVTGLWTMNTVCENWMLQKFNGQTLPDDFLKERLSLVELAFRMKEERLAEANVNLPNAMRDADLRFNRRSGPRILLDGKPSDSLKATNAKINQEFQATVTELNNRFLQARAPLNYHNGYIQISMDALSTGTIETPFWNLVADPKWKNVDTDMKEAFDRRDSRARDPAFYAVRALESAIKIISDDKGWTHGKERGAHNYIDNLSSSRFVADWEAIALKNLFTSVRNPLGHGPGSAEMPALTDAQTDWAIDTSLGWIKRLIRSTGSFGLLVVATCVVAIAQQQS
jgi:AbiJ N-terminal domain 4